MSIFNPFLPETPHYNLPKRRVFISYFKGDKFWVDKLINDYGQSGTGFFTPRAVGVVDEDDFVNSDDVDYIMQAIRDRYLYGTSVTIVVIGQCTHSRKYVDWEIKSSLLQPANGLPNGLLGLAIPPLTNNLSQPIWPVLPERFDKNFINGRQDISYAMYYQWPVSGVTFWGLIEEAYQQAVNKAYLIENSQEMIRKNLICKVHNQVHTV